MRVKQCRLFGRRYPGWGLAGQEGFEPSTIRLTAERTTAVLLTLKRKSPARCEALNSLSTYEAMATISDLHEI